jgi:hypothetical protein
MEWDCEVASSSESLEEVSLIEVFSGNDEPSSEIDQMPNLNVRNPSKPDRPSSPEQSSSSEASQASSEENEASSSEENEASSSEASQDESSEENEDESSEDESSKASQDESMSDAHDSDYVESGNTNSGEDTEPDPDTTFPEATVTRWNFDIHDPANFAQPPLMASRAGEASRDDTPPITQTFRSVKEWQKHAQSDIGFARRPGHWMPRSEYIFNVCRHPISRPVIVNETYWVTTLQQLHDVCVHECKDKWDYIQRHHLSWQVLSSNTEMYNQHTHKLAYIHVQSTKRQRPIDSLWTSFYLGVTWTFTLRALGICPQVFMLRDEDHFPQQRVYFDNCAVCTKDDYVCTCTDSEHVQQDQLIRRLLNRNTGKIIKNGGPTTIPKYCRNAHFLRQYPRLLLLNVFFTHFDAWFCTLYSKLMYVCPVLRAHCKTIIKSK